MKDLFAKTSVTIASPAQPALPVTLTVIVPTGRLTYSEARDWPVIYSSVWDVRKEHDLMDQIAAGKFTDQLVEKFPELEDHESAAFKDAQHWLISANWTVQWVHADGSPWDMRALERGHIHQLLQQRLQDGPHETMSARDAIDRVLMEMPMDLGGYPDMIHPERKRKFATREHPMAKNPAYPEFTPQPGQSETNWEEVVASGQYRDTLGRLVTFLNRIHGEDAKLDIKSIYQAMVVAVRDAMEMEKPYRRALEKLAIELIFEQPEFRKFKEPYEKGEFEIDAKLGVSGELGNILIGGEQGEEPEEGDEPEGEEPEGEEQGEEPEGEDEEQEQEAKAVEHFHDFDPEVMKRRIINAMIAGGAVSKNYAYQLFNKRLAKVNPNLPTLYGMAMAATEIGYFAMGDSEVSMAAQTPEAAGGSAEIDVPEESEEHVPVIKVRAMIFPMLVQELTKGLLELISYEGLPSDPSRAQEVIDKADLANEEAWAMIMGRGLWQRFVSAIGQDEDEITAHLYSRLIQLPTDEFNATMRTIQAGGPQAEQLVKKMAAELKADMEDEERESHGTFREQEPGPEPEGGGEFGTDPDAWKNG